MTAPGRYIPVIQRMAAFASMLLPETERNELRKRRALASEVLERFEMHHILYFTWGITPTNPPDDEFDVHGWYNLDPQLKADHRKRTQSDVGIIAKSKRIQKKQAAHNAMMDRPTVRFPRHTSVNPFVKLPSRPFPRGHKLRGKK